MAKIDILQWLYKHSPVNFYNITPDGETVIKSINNTFIGYSFDRIFLEEELNNLKCVIKNYKRFSTFSILLAYILLIYCYIFPNYDLFNSNLYIRIGIIIFAFIIPFFILALASKIFEKYIFKNFGEFKKIHFPLENFTVNKSYKEFKFEFVKIFVLLFILAGAYFWIGSPYETSLKLINNGKYKEAIKMTTLWSKIVPIDSHWYSLRGYSKFYTEDYEGAIDDFDKAYELQKDEFKYMNFDNKIYIKYFQKRYNSALKDFDNAISTATDGEKNSLLWDKAQFLYNIGKFKEALKIYNELITLSTEDRIYLMENRLYFERAQIYNSLGKIIEAKKDLDKANELNLDIEYQKAIPKPVFLLEEI